MGFTEEQKRAIEAQGKVIVSASAGSGKTTVMIERIIRHITLSGVGVDEILAVTFTKKAAASMKEKLCKALIEEINKPETDTPKRKRLKEQLSKVSTADISTIHSYCAKLIRTHFYEAEVDGGFRVIGGDDAEGCTLKNAALDELLEEGYTSKEPAFAHLLSVYFRKKKDATLRQAILDAYRTLRNDADYIEYLERVAQGYTEADFDAVCKELLKLFQEKCKYYYELAEDVYANVVDKGEGAKNQRALAEELMNWMTVGQACKDYFDGVAMLGVKFTANSGGKNVPVEKEQLGFLKKRIVAAVEGEFKDLLPREQELKNFLDAGKTAAALATYILRFDEKYDSLKKERGVLDYNDLEHIALALLKKPEVAEDARKKYRHVFVDEYQDVNPVQEAILSRLAGDSLFLVGDVKQSIYGFRGSQSKFFSQKQIEFKNGEGISLPMKKNFRSTDKVLDAINEQFSRAMTTNVCEVDYERDATMEKGGRYETKDGITYDEGRVFVHFAPKEEAEKKEAREVYSVREHTCEKRAQRSSVSDMLIRIIQEEMRGYITTELKDGTVSKRPVRYSDIAILTRKTGGAIAEQAAAIADAGIPVTTASAVNICEYSEVKTLIDILSLIDNAEQDVPLCSALLSAMGGLTLNDLADIRLQYKGKSFRKACRMYAENQKDELADKLKAFYAYFEKLRIESCVLTVGEILSKLLVDTKMEAGLLSRKSGVACLKRIRRFIEEASNFDGYCVHDFLEYLRNLEYNIEYCENGGEDSVKILTMHSSKGLEYPIVLLPNLSQPLRGGTVPAVYVEKEFGLAPFSFDTEKMLQASNLLRVLHEKRAAKDSIADELNLYYVAMTRAERALHLIFTEPTMLADVKYAKSYAEMTNFSVWEKYFVKETDAEAERQKNALLYPRASEQTVGQIIGAYEWTYAHTGYENLPVKSSPTQLLEDGKYIPKQHFVGYGKEDEWDETEDELDLGEDKRESRDLAIAEGTAYHAFLERFDFSMLVEDGKRIERLALEDLIENALTAFADEVDISLLSKEKLTEILCNPVFYGLQGMRLYKEQQFLVSLPVKDTFAKRADADPALAEKTDGEEMLFQGAIDLLAVGESVQIIDYKYSKKGAEALKEHYKAQLDLYKLAVARIMGVDANTIRCSIVNIRRGFQVDMD